MQTYHNLRGFFLKKTMPKPRRSKANMKHSTLLEAMPKEPGMRQGRGPSRWEAREPQAEAAAGRGVPAAAFGAPPTQCAASRTP